MRLERSAPSARRAGWRGRPSVFYQWRREVRDHWCITPIAAANKRRPLHVPGEGAQPPDQPAWQSAPMGKWRMGIVDEEPKIRRGYRQSGRGAGVLCGSSTESITNSGSIRVSATASGIRVALSAVAAGARA